MDGLGRIDPLTLRERQWFLVPLGIWLVASVLTALSGPFGTHDAMHFGTRVAYWGGVCAASVGFSMIAVRLQNDRSQGVKLLVWLGFALFLSASIHVANGILFGFGEALGSYIYLFAIVLVVVVLVFMTIWLVQPDVPSQPDANRMAKFLERLPLEKRGALIRLEAQDHYLKVVTRAGDCLILMRIGDAAKELDCLLYTSPSPRD